VLLDKYVCENGFRSIFIGTFLQAAEFQEDYSDLAPQQRVRKLNKKLEQIQKLIETKTHSR
jgi:hypothetical protein